MNDKLRDRILWVLFILIGICTLISVSYAYFVVSGANNANLNISVSAPSCASIDITSGTSVNITGEYAAPISDAKALSSDVFRSSFTLKNGCDKEQSLSVLLVPSSSSTMNPKALKYVLIEQNASLPKEGTLVTKEMELSANTQKELLSKYGQTYNVTTGYELTNVSISSNEEKSYYLYLWIDYDEGGLGNGITLNTNLTSTLVLGTGTDVATRTTLYSTIVKRYNKGDEFVKLYNGADYGDIDTHTYYFNGAVENNNVLFANYCWKMVRTTDTGGVKMIYNGVQKDTYETYENIEETEYNISSDDETFHFNFDTTNKTWKSNDIEVNDVGNITIKVIEAGTYQFYIKMNNDSGDDYAEVGLNENSLGHGDNCSDGCFRINDSDTIELTLNTTDEIKITYYAYASSSDGNNYVEFSLSKGVGKSYKSCNNRGINTEIGKSAFNSNDNSLAYAGYMYNKNKIYTNSIKSMSSLSNIVFGNSFTYENGTYTLKDTMTVATWSSGYNTINNNHYTCMTTDTTCTTIYYIFETYSSTASYIMLSNGSSVDDALNDMLYGDGVNTDNSTIKDTIDTWYANNMTSYTDKLEDTIFCNHRSIANKTENGWFPNGGSTSTYLYFEYGSSYSVTMACENENDRFTVNASNGNGALTYPVGLLTVPEVAMAEYDSDNNVYYLNSKSYYWLSTPYGLPGSSHVYGRYIDSSGAISGFYENDILGVRPVISLKPGTIISSGDGSYTNPYVIE